MDLWSWPPTPPGKVLGKFLLQLTGLGHHLETRVDRIWDAVDEIIIGAKAKYVKFVMMRLKIDVIVVVDGMVASLLVSRPGL